MLTEKKIASAYSYEFQKKKRVMAEIASFLLYGLRIRLRAMVFEVWPVYKTQS